MPPATAVAPPGPRPPRLPGVDVARGLAVLLMIETHAYDGWVSAAGKATGGYHVTRVLSSIPSALFLLLAGVGLSLGLASEVARGADPVSARRRLARRGLSLVLYGYGVSLAYALIEGGARLTELLRADILHCIGLSLAICATLCLGSPAERRRRVALLCLIAVFAQPVLGALHLLPLLQSIGRARGAAQPLAAALGLLIDVPPYTRFPVLPLISYTALGVLVGDWLQRGPRRAQRYLMLAAIFILLSVAITETSLWAVAHLRIVISRSQPAVLASVLNQSARALAVLTLALASPWAPRWLVQLGSGSMRAYAFHIPFCYGRLSAPLRARLTMTQATLAVLALMALTYSVVVLTDRLINARRARARASRPSASA